LLPDFSFLAMDHLFCAANQSSRTNIIHFTAVDYAEPLPSTTRGASPSRAMVRDLKGTMDREKAALGLFLTLNKPSREMIREAASAHFYETGGIKVPRLQIRSGNPGRQTSTSAVRFLRGVMPDQRCPLDRHPSRQPDLSVHS
jgi:hypothetical protein